MNILDTSGAMWCCCGHVMNCMFVSVPLFTLTQSISTPPQSHIKILNYKCWVITAAYTCQTL